MKEVCYRNNVGLIKVSPVNTSKIAEQKYCERMKLNVHKGASYVIARRGQILKNKDEYVSRVVQIYEL